MIILFDCTICHFQFPVEIPEPFTHEQPTACPNCGSRYRITSINPLWYVRDLDCQVKLSACEIRQLTEQQQQELDDQARQLDIARLVRIIQTTLNANDQHPRMNADEEAD